MITPSMTDEELQAAAYQDFLEIKMKVQISIEQFGRNLKLSCGQKRFIHSLMETTTIRTKAKNTWNICYVNDNYSSQADGDFFVIYFVYLPLHRGENVDFLFMTVMPDFLLQRVSCHFLQRYKERYLDCNKVNLRGMHPALYYMYKNLDRTEAYYQPENWTEDDMKDKKFMISAQGLSVVKFIDKMMIYITFLDQENLSRYKSQVYEEESYLKDFIKLSEAHEDIKLWQVLHKKMYADPEKAKKYMSKFISKTNLSEKDRELMNDMMENWDEFIDFQDKLCDYVDEMNKEEQPKSLFDIGVQMTKKMKQGRWN